jgi:hypothetical protein
MNDIKQTYIYGGISNVNLAPDEYDLSHGVTLKRTYAHLMSPCVIAYKPAEPGKHHPGPWRAAKGGFSYDINTELSVPSNADLPGKLNPKETVWWIAALLRLAHHPHLMVPTISDQSFSGGADADIEPTIEPFETTTRIFSLTTPNDNALDEPHLSWVKEVWVSGAHLLLENPKLASIIQAFDSATINGRTSSAMMSIWSGIEQLFCPSPGELRYRVSANLATFLEEPGEKRLKLFKQIMKLYDERSTAAHTTNDISKRALLESFVIMRNALVKILNTNLIPTQESLEREMFNPTH